MNFKIMRSFCLLLPLQICDDLGITYCMHTAGWSDGESVNDLKRMIQPGEALLGTGVRNKIVRWNSKYVLDDLNIPRTLSSRLSLPQ